MLYLNKNPDKQAVAREKVLRYHDLSKVNFVPSSLSVALSWVENTKSEKRLSQIFGILRRVPHMIREKKKHKLEEASC